MPEFIKINDSIAVTEQINEIDVDRAFAQGFRTVVCNRPDHEEEDQPLVQDIERRAHNNGMTFAHIPIEGTGPTMKAVQQTRKILDKSDGPILAYCLTGGRSTKIWALAEALAGVGTCDEIINTAANAGYNLSGLRPDLVRVAS